MREDVHNRIINATRPLLDAAFQSGGAVGVTWAGVEIEDGAFRVYGDGVGRNFTFDARGISEAIRIAYALGFSGGIEAAGLALDPVRMLIDEALRGVTHPQVKAPIKKADGRNGNARRGSKMNRGPCPRCGKVVALHPTGEPYSHVNSGRSC